jgi:hypothetical protein
VCLHANVFNIDYTKIANMDIHTPLCVTMAQVSIQLRHQRSAVRTQLTLFRPYRSKHYCSKVLVLPLLDALLPPD